MLIDEAGPEHLSDSLKGPRERERERERERRCDHSHEEAGTWYDINGQLCAAVRRGSC